MTAQSILKSLRQKDKPMSSQNTQPVKPQLQLWREPRIQASALVLIIALLGLLFIADPAAWMTLTLAGLAMGMMLFIMTSGFTLVFGLMDVLNFGHGAFISIGAFVGYSVLMFWPELMTGSSVIGQLGLFVLSMLIAGVVVAAFALLFEKFIIRSTNCG